MSHNSSIQDISFIPSHHLHVMRSNAIISFFFMPCDSPKQTRVTKVLSEAMATDRERVCPSHEDPPPYIATGAPRLTKPQAGLRGVGTEEPQLPPFVTLSTLTKVLLREAFVPLRFSIGQRGSSGGFLFRRLFSLSVKWQRQGDRWCNVSKADPFFWRWMDEGKRNLFVSSGDCLNSNYSRSFIRFPYKEIAEMYSNSSIQWRLQSMRETTTTTTNQKIHWSFMKIFLLICIHPIVFQKKGCHVFHRL